MNYKRLYVHLEILCLLYFKDIKKNTDVLCNCHHYSHVFSCSFQFQTCLSDFTRLKKELDRIKFFKRSFPFHV